VDKGPNRNIPANAGCGDKAKRGGERGAKRGRG